MAGAGRRPGILKQSLGGLGTQDEYGVWSVASPGRGPYAELLPFGPHKRRDAERALDRAAVKDAEADPYGALKAALDTMDRKGRDDDRPELIVFLTDDEDDNHLTAKGHLDELLNSARTKGVPVVMAALDSGGCAKGRPDQRISDASGGRCLDTKGDLVAGLRDEVARTGTGTSDAATATDIRAGPWGDPRAGSRTSPLAGPRAGLRIWAGPRSAADRLHRRRAGRTRLYGLPGASGDIVVASGRDVTGKGGIRQQLIDAWNARQDREHSDVHARLVELPGSADQQRSQLLGALQSGSAQYDIVNLDVTWVPEFAAAHLIRPLPDDLVDADVVKSVASTARWGGKLYAVPFNSDVGLLYYRRDHLKRAHVQDTDLSKGITWRQLRDLVDAVEAPGRSRPKGYEKGWTTQLGPYEGRTVNGIEAFLSATDGAASPTRTAVTPPPSSS